MKVSELKKALEDFNDDDIVVRVSRDGLENIYDVRLEQISDNFCKAEDEINAVVLD